MPDITSEAAETAPRIVLAIGASADGREAFSEFIRKMPPHSGMAFVLVPHFAPEHECHMAEQLAGEITMPVQMAEDEMPVEPDRVYVLPPNAILRIEEGVLRLTRPADPGGCRMVIDAFFSSLAEDFQDRAIGILLSGTGSDGTQGLRAIKENGGLTMAQVADLATHDASQKNAAGARLVDYVLPVSEMPDRVIEYDRHLQGHAAAPGAEPPEDEDEDHLQQIFHSLQLCTGHDFGCYKKGTVLRRIQRRMRVLQADSLAEYAGRLSQDPAEAEELFRDLLISVTHFFRESAAFDTLGKLVVPRMLEGRDSSSTVRIWVPGCATGEEAYSIAILLSEHLQRMKDPPKLLIFATDIDEHALDIARTGRYSDSITEHVSPERLRRFFKLEGSTYLVVKELREMCLFSSHNVIKDPPFSALDLVSCRNLLIYFETDLQKRLVRLFHYALRQGGHLLLGPSENVAAATDLFRTVDQKQRLFQAKPTAVRVPISFPLTRPSRSTPSMDEQDLTLQTTREQSTARALERTLLENFAPAGAVIHESGTIAYFIGRCGKFLEPGVGVPSNNLVDMTREGLRLPLRTAIYQAVKGREEVVQDRLSIQSTGQPWLARIIVRPFEEFSGDHDLYIVIFQEVEDTAKPDGSQPAPKAADTSLCRQLENELRQTREHLQATIEELKTSNEELKSSNEELLSMNEELQSSNEEMQTSKEELQSVNEELETVNTELHKKIEELDRAGSDLKNLFQSTQIATIFLDPDLRIKRFTPAATQIFRFLESDVGRQITDFRPQFEGVDLSTEVQEVLRTLASREHPVHMSGSGRHYILRLNPYRTLSNVIAGVVLTFVDVTELVREQRERSRLAAIVSTSQDSIIGKDLDGNIISWNPAAQALFGYTAAEAIGMNISMIIPQEHQPLWKSALERLRRGETVEPMETLRVGKDGTLVELQIAYSLVRDENGTPVGISSIGRDVRPLKLAEKEALRSAAEVRAIMEAVPAVVWIAEDREGVVIKGNRESYRFLRLPEGENQSLTAPQPERPGHFRVMKNGRELSPEELPVQRACRTGQPVRHWENDVVFEDGEMRKIFGNAVPLLGQDGVCTGSVAAFIDITELKQAQETQEVMAQELTQQVLDLEAARQEADRANQAKDRFIAILSHELRTPLTPVLAAVQLAARDKEDLPRSIRELLDVTERNLLLETKLIDDLLDLNRLTYGKMKLDRRQVELASSISDAIEICHADWQGKRIKVRSEIEDSLWVNADPARLRQIIWNLLRNSIRHSPPDSEILISARKASDTEVALKIVDHGCGISAERLPFIFDAFKNGSRPGASDNGGLGIGLAICKALVELHGGTISVLSEGEDHGTTFTITLPLTTAPDFEADKKEPDELQSAQFGGRKVLVVEDHEDTAHALVRLLRRRGLEVVAASTIKEAMQILERESFDILLSDLGLPDGHGTELMRQVRENNLTLPSIALSGFGMDTDVEFALKAGFGRHLTKPVEISKLERAVAALLAEKQPTSS